MAQIVVTLERGADEKFIRKVIENMKGVLRTSVNNVEKVKKAPNPNWLDKVHNLRDTIDQAVIDKTDPRTQYLLSK